MRILISILLLLAARICVNTSVHAGESGDLAVVIYNTRMPGSKELASHYAESRNVPANQIVGFKLPTGEDMSREEFRDDLQLPLARKLEKLKLWKFDTVTLPATNGQPEREITKVVDASVRYAVLCYGVPLRILPDKTLFEPGAEKLQTELQRNEAAVDNELAWLPMVRNRNLLAGPMVNHLYGVTNGAYLHPTNGILMVARLDGPTPEIARGLVDKAIQAEKDGLWGRAYFDTRSITEEGFKKGDEWISHAADVCRQLGFDVTEDKKPGVFPAGFPLSQIAIYAGWYAENASGPFALPKVEFMPGAFAYHLHSWSGCTLRSTTKHWLGPFLDKGVTATMGSVWEPYLAGTPDVGTFCARFIYFGFSFGEAAYASQTMLSWQTTVVGDPLYRPFARPLPELHQQLEREDSPLVAWSHERVLNLNTARGTRPAELLAYLKKLKLTDESAVLSEKMGDLLDKLGKPSSARHAYEQALKLDASPMQKARLRLQLGQAYLNENNTEKAYQHYHDLLADWPDYPDRIILDRKLLPLARKLNKTEEADRIEAELQRLTPASGGK